MKQPVFGWRQRAARAPLTVNWWNGRPFWTCVRQVPSAFLLQPATRRPPERIACAPAADSNTRPESSGPRRSVSESSWTPGSKRNMTGFGSVLARATASFKLSPTFTRTIEPETSRTPFVPNDLHVIGSDACAITPKTPMSVPRRMRIMCVFISFSWKGLYETSQVYHFLRRPVSHFTH